MSIRVVVHQDRTLKDALAILRKQLRRQALDDRRRHRWWGAASAKKPGYVRRQKKFFSKCRARATELWFQHTGEHWPHNLRWWP